MKWEKRDIDYLVKKYPSNIPMAVILKALRRSKIAITHKAARLGISRPFIPVNKPKDPNYRKIVDKRYYEKNKKKIYKRKKERELNYKLEMIKNLGGKCGICGYNKCIAALEFHHKIGNKETEISIMLKKSSKQKILKEAEKCVLLCTNCHRELHYKGL